MERERQKLIDSLTAAWSADAIDMEAYEAFVEQVHRAQSRLEIDEVSRSIARCIPSAQLSPAPVSSTTANDTPASPRTAAPAAPPLAGRIQQSSCLLSDRNYRGDWLREAILTDTTVLGNTVYDFRDCVFPSYEIQLELMTVLGAVEIIVPRNVAVRMEANAILGEASLHKSVKARPGDGDVELVITGSVLLGSVIVKSK